MTAFPIPAEDDRSYLLERIRGRRRKAAAPDTIEAPPPTDQLSFAQERLWFLEQLDPGTAVFNEAFAVDLDGPLDPARLHAALDAVVARHEALRTGFVMEDGALRQYVTDAARVPFDVDDSLADLPPTERDTALEARLKRFAIAPFDLTRAPLLRARLFRLGSGRHCLALVNHHLVADAHSRRIILADLSRFYRGDAPEAAPAFRLFSGRQRNGPADAALDHWRREFAGSLPRPYPTDFPRPSMLRTEGRRIERVVGADISGNADALAARLGATPFMLIAAAFAFVLARTSEAEEVVFGFPVDARETEEDQRIVGFCANTLPLHLRIDPRATPAELVAHVKAQTISALAHAAMPFERIVQAVNPDRDLSRGPLFDMLLSLQPDVAAPPFAPDIAALHRRIDVDAARFDLSIEILPGPAGYRLSADYRTSLFESASVSAVADRLIRTLALFSAETDTPLSQIDLTSDAERSTILDVWNPPDEAACDMVPVVYRFARQVASQPDRHAVSGGGMAWTYAELDAASRRVRDTLAQAGLISGTRVGVAVERTPWLVAAILGILRAGCIYVPLDETWPEQRLRQVLGDCRCAAAISSGDALRVLKAAGCPLLIDPWEISESSGSAGRDVPLGSDDTAYILYTSGSTGLPKGVAIGHGNLAAFLDAMDGLLDEGKTRQAAQTWLAATSTTFDVSLLELLWTVSAGKSLVLAESHLAVAAEPMPAPMPDRAGSPGLSIMFFAADVDAEPAERYRFMIEAARRADAAGLEAVWLPERHFHRFGGLFPNPALLAAALALETKTIALRAGSVVAPLHDALRIAEEWSVVDNLSGGRVAVSFASGWHANDFVLAPERYADRHRVTRETVEAVRRLWRGGTVSRINGVGETIEVGLLPPPVQAELPVWITASQSPDTFDFAGRIGANILTHLLQHSLEELTEKVGLYRRARAAAGHTGNGRVTLMLHTLIAESDAAAAAVSRVPMKRYLEASLDLVRELAETLGHTEDVDRLEPGDREAILDLAFTRYAETAGLIGGPETAAAMVARVRAAGVDEIACLVDFGVPAEAALGGIGRISALAEAMRQDPGPQPDRTGTDIAALRPHPRIQRITHYQTTPSALRHLIGTPGGREWLGTLDTLLVGGEALGADLASAVRGLARRTINLYGPTEATIWATTAEFDAEEADARPPSIGRPLPGARAYVLDAVGRLAGPGMPGMLWLGGRLVGQGYVGRPDLTEAAFAPDPFSTRPGARIYRTGDRAVWTADGRLRFLGRNDGQIKLFGRRIETGEIEAVCRRHPGVAECAVRLFRLADDDIRIVAYVVANAGEAIAEASLREHAAALLPKVMMPSRFVALAILPLTTSGKLHREALPRPDFAGTEPSPRDPTIAADEATQAVITLWRREFGVEASADDTSFFDAGGHSLLAARMIARCREAFGARIALAAFFRDPTPSGLARLLREGRPAPPD